MRPIEELGPDQLHRRCDPYRIDVETTDDVDVGVDLVGQPRVLAAMRFGVDIDDQDCNVFAVGPAGAGKRFFVRRFLDAQARGRLVPDDPCYVSNFAEANGPIALLLPPRKAVDPGRA